jgi:hypothetical protein
MTVEHEGIVMSQWRKQSPHYEHKKEPEIPDPNQAPGAIS